MIELHFTEKELGSDSSAPVLLSRPTDQLPNAPVLDLQQDLLRLEVAFTVRQQLRQVEERNALREQLGYHAS